MTDGAPDIVFSLASVPALLGAALELYQTVADADEALMPDVVLEAAQDFKSLVDEHVDLLDGPRTPAPFDWDGPS